MPFIAIVYVPDHTADVVVPELEKNHGQHLVALFDYPNRSELRCRGGCMDKKLSSWSRSPFGFMKCNVCGSRPKKTRSRLIGHLFDLLGANLVKDAPAAFRTPEGYGPFPR